LSDGAAGGGVGAVLGAAGGAAAGAELPCWPLPHAASTNAAARALRASFVFIDEIPKVIGRPEGTETDFVKYETAFYSVLMIF
jgi:hypothetical protein